MANEDYLTFIQRKFLIFQARTQIGAHYLRGGNGDIPPSGSNQLTMLENGDQDVILNGKNIPWGNYFTAKNSYRVCSGKHGSPAVEKMPKGDGHNPAHLANPETYKWQRVVTFKNINPLWGESCVGKMHFDCSGFVKWLLRDYCPLFRQTMTKTNCYTIKGIRKLLTPVGPTGALVPDDLCAGDILIRKNNGHIGFAAGSGQTVIQAEWEQSGVVETDLQKWEFHGRIPRNYWFGIPPEEPLKLNHL